MIATSLASRKCHACTEKTPLLSAAQTHELLPLVPGWELSPDARRISRMWHVLDFATGLNFLRLLGEVAEQEDHHPDLHLTNYREVTVVLWTHVSGGVTENDFILAAKINALEQPALKA